MIHDTGKEQASGERVQGMSL